MENSKQLEYHSKYVENINSGRYIMPPIILIYDMLKRRYGEERVDVDHLLDLPNSKTISLENIGSMLVFSKIWDSMGERSIISGIDDVNFFDKFRRYDISTFMIHYPKVRISNTLKISHIINDLYIQIKINYEGSMSRFTLNRGSYTLEEIVGNYKHSHSSTFIDISRLGSTRNTLQEFQSVCLGNSPLSGVVSSMSGIVDFNEVNFNYFLLLLDEFVSWESLEGVPYRKIANLRGTSSLGRTIITQDIYDMLSPTQTFRQALGVITSDRVMETLIMEYFTVNPTVVEGRPYLSVKYDELKVQEYLIETLRGSLERRALPEVSYTTDDLGKISYFTDSVSESTRNIYKANLRSLQDMALFTFKGEWVKLNIIGLERGINSIMDSGGHTLLHPILLHKVIKLIEDIINFKYGQTKPIHEVSYA